MPTQTHTWRKEASLIIDLPPTDPESTTCSDLVMFGCCFSFGFHCLLFENSASFAIHFLYTCAFISYVLFKIAKTFLLSDFRVPTQRFLRPRLGSAPTLLRLLLLFQRDELVLRGSIRGQSGDYVALTTLTRSWSGYHQI